MSFIDDIIDFGKDLLGGNNIWGTIATTIATGYALNKVTSSINKTNSLPSTATATPLEPDRGVRLQVNPDPQHKIPVVYGSAHLGGIITDAQIANNNTTMYYCLAISEKTGSKVSDTFPSEFRFEDIYWNDQRIVFKEDGITAAYSVDRDSNIDYSIADLVKIYCYNGSSTLPVAPDNYSNSSLPSAYSIFPGWTSSHMMTGLIFAVVRVDYSREKNVTNIPTISFHVTNSMTLPGDCLYDYMTNTVYGAGIPVEEINIE